MFFVYLPEGNHGAFPGGTSGLWGRHGADMGDEAELKHGRLAMFAAVAWPLAEAALAALDAMVRD